MYRGEIAPTPAHRPTVVMANVIDSVRPPFDPELAPVLAAMREATPKTNQENLAQVRSLIADGVPGVPKPDFTAGGAVDIDTITVTGPEDAPDLRMTVLRPAEGQGPWPAIYHVHGGGMVAGTPETMLDAFVPYVHEVGVVVTSVDYRLAPEHPHPASIEDCYAGLRWLGENADELGVDPTRIMIAGTSAGGGLAAATALMARDRGFPALTHQMLLCPMLDDRCQTPSSQMLVDEGLWDGDENEFGWSSLLGESRGSPDVSPYAAPARAEDLSGLPRTFISVGSVDTFRDEVLDYATRLSQAGVSVDLHLWGGGFHGFDLLPTQSAIGQAAVVTRDEFLRRALAK
jgi:acetyl esterase/lipase